MAVQTFRAGVQYGDLRGSAAADRADQNDAEHWLEKNGHKGPDEFLVGIELWAGESHGKHKDPIFATFLLASPRKHDNVKAQIESGNPLQVRRVKVDMPLVEFFGLFKRFSIALSAHGMLEGREYAHAD